MRWPVVLALVLLSCDTPVPPIPTQPQAPKDAQSAKRPQPQRPGQENSLTRAVFADGRLWLLSDAGDVSSITEGSDARIDASLPERALDMCARSGVVEVVTCPASDCGTWTLKRWTDNQWSTVTSIATAGDHLLALACSATTTTLLTDQRLVDVTAGKQTPVKLSNDLDTKGVTSIHVTSDYIFVGVNRGEWGGGLQRIERRNGKVALIGANESGELCGGPLNAECDPVNGIASAPWNPGCVAVAVGLVHFSPHGRIAEVCGDRVRRIYVKPFDRSSTRHGQKVGAGRRNVDEPFETVAFFGLAKVREELWAVGINGLYRFKDERNVIVVPLPEFKAIGNVGVSFDLPDAILVLTSVNQRLAMSGNVPMLVPR